MAPEQAQAVACVRQGRPITTSVDGRADIYALGLLLYQALSGRDCQAGETGTPPFHRINPIVSPGLSDIIHKCLCSKSSGRYRDAASLATDLRCHLADLPLRGVPNRSLAENWRKWRRRRPQGLVVTALLLVASVLLLGAGGWLWAGYHRQVGESEASLAEGHACFRRGQYGEAALAFRRGLVQAAYLPFFEPMRRELASGLAAASRREKAAELHRLADLIRIRYAIGQIAPAEANWLIGKGREIWEARSSLKFHDSDGSQPVLDETVSRDMLEILSLWTDLRVRMAPAANRDAARRESAQILAQAAREFGPIPSASPTPDASPHDAEQPGTAPTQPPSTAWHQYELGRSFLRSGDYQHASEHFRKGLELRPQDFWLNFYEGLCKYRTKNFEDAVHAFHICIVLSPDTAECYFNRGLSYQELGNCSRALRDYDRCSSSIRISAAPR